MKLRDLWGGGKHGRQVLLLAMAVLGIFLLLLGHLDTGTREAKPADVVGSPEVKTGGKPVSLQIQSEEEYLAQRLENLLQQVSGVGRVDVSVRLEHSTTSEYAVNTTVGRKISDESSESGTTRVTTEVSESGQLVVVRGERGYEIPVVERELASRVTGVLVVAEGARDPAIKAELFRATRVALGVEPHKILVLPKKF
jgi:stage III sporulation protein AG